MKGSISPKTRGADSTRGDGIKRASFLKAEAVFASVPIAEHDDALVLDWFRRFAAEPIKHKDKPDGPRSPYTVRNYRRELRELYKFAQRHGYFPRDRSNPANSEEVRAELRHLLTSMPQREVMLPLESLDALLSSEGVSGYRKLLTHVYGYTGLRPGELHGLLVSDVMTQGETIFLSVTKQWTLGRSKQYPPRYAPPKTKWSVRPVPVHPSLTAPLTLWVRTGWEEYVGRSPTPTDPLFPDEVGAPFREDRSDDFRADLVTAGCATSYKGVELNVYSLRHSFATMAREAGIPDEDRDVLLGHRRKSTKALNYEVARVPHLYEQIAKLPFPAARGRKAEEPLVPFLVSTAVPGLASTTRSIGKLAEEERFELPDGLHRRRFSKPLP